MILKNQTVKLVKDVTVVEFGKGDVNIGMTSDDFKKQSGIMMWNIKPGEIGRVESIKDKTFADLQPSVVMTFTELESIDVVIYRLKQVRKHLETVKNKKNEQH